MKKNLNLIFAAFAATALLLSCVKEEPESPIEEVTPEEESSAVEQITISATLSEALTKVGFAPSYENGKPSELVLTWSEGDKLRVYDHADRTKYDDFTLTTESVGQKEGDFEGTPSHIQGATTFDVEVVGADDFSYSAQTQPADGVTSDLKYLASAAGLSDFTQIEFTEFSSVLAVTVKLPEGVAAKVNSVDLKASEKIFDTSDRLTVTLAQTGDAEGDGILHVFATLPLGTKVIPESTTLVAHFNAPDTDHTVYTRFVELGSDLSFVENKLNTININAANSATYANASVENIGTEANPYLVGDKYQFDAMRNCIKDEMAYFEMVDDIDMTGIAWNPLNTKPANVFCFNGNNHTLSNVTSSGSQGYQSVFGCISGTVENLKIDKAVMVAGSAISGVLASHLGANGSTMESVVNNITITNSTLGTADQMGTKKFGILAGVVENPNGAQISNITISDCSVASSSDYVGGMISTISKPTVISGTNNIVKTNVYGKLAGGVIGYADNVITMSGCTYTGGTVTPSGMNSGCMIASAANYESVISDCHVQDAVLDASGLTIELRCGGFIGRLDQKVTLKGCTLGTESKRVTVKLGAPAKDIRANAGGFVGLAYGTITKDGDVRNKAYVTVTCANAEQTRQLNVGGFAGIHQYNTIEYCDADVLMEDMTGTYIGGFCGVSVSGSIQHCNVTGTVTGANFTGGFVGEVDGGTISYCTSAGKITSIGGSVGGFTGGTNSDSATCTIENCSSSAEVYGYTNVGGFVGSAVGTYRANHSSGTVTASGGSAGGFAGRILDYTTAEFSKNYATGDVFAGGHNIGGLIGYIGGDLTMSDCYATGNAKAKTGSKQKVAGLVGYILDNAKYFTNGISIIRCYAAGNVEGTSASGGLIGRIVLPSISLTDCVAWNSSVVAKEYTKDKWSTAAVVGVAHPKCVLKNNYRKPDMSLTAYWVPDMKTFQHADVSPESPLTDSNGAEMEDASTASGQTHYPLYPYHGKVEADKTLSALARDVLHWSEEIWDFTSDLPVLK